MRLVRRDVDDRVPRVVRDRRQLRVAIAQAVLHVRRQRCIRPSAVKARDVVPGPAQRVDDMATQELRAAENEDLHRGGRSTREHKNGY